MAHKMSFPVVDDVCAKFKMGSSLPRGKNGAGRAQKVSQIADRTFVDVEGTFDSSFSAAGGSIVLWVLYPVSAVRQSFALVFVTKSTFFHRA